MNDKDYADRIRADAARLASTMEDAAKAGLLMEVSFQNTYSSGHANGDITKGGWHPCVRVWRTSHA